jgi:hypothetical protein
LKNVQPTTIKVLIGGTPKSKPCIDGLSGNRRQPAIRATLWVIIDFFYLKADNSFSFFIVSENITLSYE